MMKLRFVSVIGFAFACVFSLALPSQAHAAVGYGGSGEGGGGSNSGGGGGGGGATSAGCSVGIVAPAEGFSVSIASENGVAYDRTVQLTLNGGTAARMALSNDPGFVGSSIEAYSSSKGWMLTEGEGAKTVYVRFYDGCGFPTNLVQATVNYRATRAPSGTVSADTEEGQVLGERIEFVDTLISQVQYGRRSPAVRTLQIELARLGYMPTGWRVTDFYGTVTRDAVNRYIAQRGADNQIVDAEIESLLLRVSFGQRSADVTRLQNLLKQRGFFPQTVRSTGLYWNITRDSVRRFRAATSST